MINRFFPELRLTRRDKLRQAISWVKATDHNLWTSDQEPKPRGTPRYDFAKLDAQITLLSLVETRWQELFSAWSVRPLTLVYEDFQQDYEGTAVQILDQSPRNSRDSRSRAPWKSEFRNEIKWLME